MGGSEGYETAEAEAASPDVEMTEAQRAAMERATLQIHADIAAILADPAYRAARGPTYAERREAGAPA